MKRIRKTVCRLNNFLILNCGNEYLNQVLNFRVEFDNIVPRYRSITKSPFLGTSEITFLGT